MQVDAPEIVSEVTACFEAYERALMDNDLDALRAMFWDSPATVRFGPGQNLYGIDAITAFRTARVGGSPRRTLSHTLVTTFGADFAVVSTEFQREGAARTGRQSQTWARIDGAWRIVAAHVSLLGEGA
jgi:ketosteroid isomerase-like protein